MLTFTLLLLVQAHTHIIDRQHWDGPPPTLRAVTTYPSPKQAINTIVVHHSDFYEAEGPKAILDYHLQVSKFDDIAYHFVVSRDGKIYEGRAINKMGAHAGQTREANRAVVAARKISRAAVNRARKLDPDYGAIGIVLDGTFGREEPLPIQKNALVRLIEKLRGDYDIETDDIITHRDVKFERIESRQLTFTGKETDCPGDAAHAWFYEWRDSLPPLHEQLELRLRTPR